MPHPTLTWGRIEEIGSTPLDKLTPRMACGVVARLEGVGRWILKPEVVRCARADAEGLGPGSVPPADWTEPPPGRSVGDCRVLVVNRDRERLPLLRPCFALPLRWCEDLPHSPLLPRGLTILADRVIAALDAEPRVKGRPWGLRPGPYCGLDRCDLGALGMDGSSAWAPLAAGLILAADRIAPDPGVWATGEWDPARGMVDVGGLESKLDLASEFQARTIFVPAGQKGPAERWRERTGGACEIRGFPDGATGGLRSAIGEFLARSGARPGDGESFEIRVRYYLRQTDPEWRRRYYIEDLLPELAGYYRSCLPAHCRPTHLVTVASDSPELVVLLAAALPARRCLILFTDDRRGRMEEAAAGVRSRVPRCEVLAGEVTRDDGMPVVMKGRVDGFIESVAPGEILFDLTPGAKDMSLELAMSIAPAGSYLFYLRHEFAADRRAVPAKREPLVQRVHRTPAAPRP
jgi:hypothetical protein